jgi:ubiquinone/menaquinone biosynthesis C-methylase UbiE
MALERVLETEVMDSWEEAFEYDSMDHSEVNRAFVSDLLVEGDIEGEILDLGTGTAQIPIELCQQCETCYVMAVDLSVHMLEQARYNIEIAGEIERIQLDLVDVKDLPHGSDRFAAVISNGTLHHIADVGVVVAQAARVAAPGGLIFFRDLLRPDSEQSVRQLVERYAAQEGERPRRMFENSLRAALCLDEIRDLVTAEGFDAETVQATSDRHWTWRAHKGG